VKQGFIPPQALETSSAMWAANAATVTPSIDASDGRVHITPANLKTMPHRAKEVEQTAHTLKMIFPEGKGFVHHPPVIDPDEGSANHMRLCSSQGGLGLHVFVYGKDSQKYPVRQSREACEAIVKQHQLSKDQVIFVQQNPEAIDAGVFHNDVIAISNENVLICHEQAFLKVSKLN